MYFQLLRELFATSGTKFPMRIVITAFVLLSAFQSAAVADSAAQFLTKLFITVCVPNLGQPAKVRKWAQGHQLAEIQDPAALGLFVGPGGPLRPGEFRSLDPREDPGMCGMGASR
jgi:hypothetical protein